MIQALHPLLRQAFPDPSGRAGLGSQALLILLGLLSLPLCTVAKAQESGLDLTSIPFEKLTQTEVITASKLAKQVSDSPSAVSIVTAEDIRSYGYRTLADVINGMRGLYTTYDRRYEYLGGRGFGAPGDYVGRIMVLVDGNSVQDNIYNQAYIDNSGLLDLELIDRVEYVPGTGSVTYGNNALLGIINVISKKGSDFNSAQIASEAASHGGQKQRISVGKRLDNGSNFLVSASRQRSDGQSLYIPYFDSPQQNNGVAVGQDYEHSQRFFAKLEFEGLSLQAAKASRTKATPVPRRENAFNRTYALADASTHLSAQYDFNIVNELKSVSRLYYGHYEDNTLREYGEPDPNEYFRLNKTHGKWWGLDQKFALTALQGHTVIFGFEFRNDFKQEVRAVALDAQQKEQFEYLRSPFSNKTYSLYASDEFVVSPTLSANLGLRYDQPNARDCSVSPCVSYAKKAALSPRLALVYMPDPRTTIKASYSQAFRLPNPYEVNTPVPSTLFQPEKVGASELVLQQDFTPTLRITGAVYDYRLSDQSYRSSQTGLRQFHGLSKTRGLELQLDQSWRNQLKLRTSAAWQSAQGVEGKRLVNSPKLLAKFNLSWLALEDSLRIGVEGQYIGNRLTLPLRDSNLVVIREGRPIGGVSLLNLTLSSTRTWYGLGATFSVKNALDRRYEVPAADTRYAGTDRVLDTMAMDGRTFWLQLSLDFWR
ncbi:TonB-dependent receptor plug domain-containing protein [Roseateles sp.]|uniref:TonB-dependent receptor plug domain-containing protein n=1 Tax=Roseateles sp. TaxID=1971397 RepID=UPI003BA81188